MIHLTNISKQFGPKVLYRGASIQISPGSKIGLVGPNGAGKTTLFKIILGEEAIDEGTVAMSDRLTLGHFSQDVGEMQGRSILQEVLAGAGKVATIAEQLKACEEALERSAIEPLEDAAMTKLLEAYGDAQHAYEQADGYSLQARAEEICEGLGLKDRDRDVGSLSGGWKMRVALAQNLLRAPDVLLMDEPTNHLDIESILWMEKWLMEFPGALVMTSHDREFMNRIVTKVLEVSHQGIHHYSGNYDFYLTERTIRQTQLLAAHRKQSDMLAREEEFIARFGARASHAAQVQSRVKKLEKIERIEIPSDEKEIAFCFPVTPRGGNDVVKIESAGKTFAPDGKGRFLFKNVTSTIKRGDKVAVTGVNGAGKSTFLKCIIHELELTVGSTSLGAGISVGYFSQHALEVLNPNNTLIDEVHNRIPQSTIGFVRNLLGSFLFSGDDVFKKIAHLSGGEKSRLVLACILAQPVNLLVLDEPTNHLDMISRELLLEALQKFEGSIVFVSHDRHFLRSLATRVFDIRAHEMHVYDGTYSEYLSRSGQ